MSTLDALLVLERQLNQVILGKPREIRYFLAAIISGGHILLEDVPGTGKTTLVKALAQGLGADFKRIQCTPDLLPADVVGGAVYNPKEGTFHIRKGPIFSQILLADEINRASPRTQSALLEAMEEGQVTLEGETYPLPEDFTVIATENPLGFAGTNPLPEAQLDRFLVRIEIGYPAKEAEKELVQKGEWARTAIQQILQPGDINALRTQAQNVAVHPDLAEYLVHIGQITRDHSDIDLGLSPRALIAIVRFAKSLSFIEGKSFVQPEILLQSIISAGSHRLFLRNSNAPQSLFLRELLSKLPIPR